MKCNCFLRLALAVFSLKHEFISH